MDDIEYQILHLGSVKYDRLKAISLLRNALKSFGYLLTLAEAKELFDIVSSGQLEDSFNGKYRYCFDQIFDQNEYVKLNEHSGLDFPTNWISPCGV